MYTTHEVLIYFFFVINQHVIVYATHSYKQSFNNAQSL